MAIALAILGSLFLWRDKPLWPYLYGVAGLFLIAGLIAPRLLAPIEWAWMKMAQAMGIVMTKIILSLTFYLVITPLGLIRRIFGTDSLKLKFDRNEKSYWVEVDPEGPTSRHDKPY
jgi:hypothetical protein